MLLQRSRLQYSKLSLHSCDRFHALFLALLAACALALMLMLGTARTLHKSSVIPIKPLAFSRFVVLVLSTLLQLSFLLSTAVLCCLSRARDIRHCFERTCPFQNLLKFWAFLAVLKHSMFLSFSSCVLPEIRMLSCKVTNGTWNSLKDLIHDRLK